MSYADKKITVTKLRANLYKLLDEVIETGIPIEINRKGKTILISLEEKPSIFNRLDKRNLTPDNMSEDDLIYHGYGIPEDDKTYYINPKDSDSLAADDGK
ncbi:MAG: type II toxin-antitoxin system Phd/YefM family antitoxin [Bacteroidia bacterium]|nr:type II toxin-antitoxin system Phd/YefM family antitoxin [Bacteroidia bacterium]